ncbi:hypothetical protein [Treponema sp.]|uniref:hypothetical protein n=1 Tax=Treponema sp. TaxID=166 RepID=UPI003EFD86B4
MKNSVKLNKKKKNNNEVSVDITGLINGEIRFNGQIIATVVDGEIKNYPLAGTVSKTEGEKNNLETRKLGIMERDPKSSTRNKKSLIDTKVGNPL